MRRWVLDDDDDRFGQGEAEKLVADWTDEVLLFGSATPSLTRFPTIL